MLKDKPPPGVVESAAGSGDMLRLLAPAHAPVQPAPTPSTSHETLDVRNGVVEFNAKKRPHKNAPHSNGSRTVLVFCNYDMDFVGQNNDPRTVEIKQQCTAMPDNHLAMLPCNSGALVDAARTNLIQQLYYARWESERCNNGSNHSKYSPDQQISKISTGAKRLLSAKKTLPTRRSGRVSSQEQMLWASVQAYAKEFCPMLCWRYDSCFVARDAMCNWHVDNGCNIGPSAITVLGDFDGG